MSNKWKTQLLGKATLQPFRAAVTNVAKTFRKHVQCEKLNEEEASTFMILRNRYKIGQSVF